MHIYTLCPKYLQRFNKFCTSVYKSCADNLSFLIYGPNSKFKRLEIPRKITESKLSGICTFTHYVLNTKYNVSKILCISLRGVALIIKQY